MSAGLSAFLEAPGWGEVAGEGSCFLAFSSLWSPFRHTSPGATALASSLRPTARNGQLSPSVVPAFLPFRRHHLSFSASPSTFKSCVISLGPPEKSRITASSPGA